MKFNCQNKNRWWSVGRIANPSDWRDDKKLDRECRIIIRMLPGESRVTVFRAARKVSDEGGSDLSGFRGGKSWCVFRVPRETELFEEVSQSFVTRIGQRTNRETRIRIVRCKWFATRVFICEFGARAILNCHVFEKWMEQSLLLPGAISVNNR